MNSKLIFHAPPSAKAQKLAELFKEKFSEVYTTSAGFQPEFLLAQDLTAEDQENLIIAFPDSCGNEDLEEIMQQVLTESFQQIQRFVQIRIKKKLGRILCLIDAGANGLAYEGNASSSSAYLSAQAGLVGLTKTVTKEYSKRGIIINVLYIDWQAVDPEEVVNTSLTLLIGNTHLRGQVFAIDGGKWL